MDKTVARLNIEHFRKLLATEMDGVKRQTIVRLLAEEEKKLAALMGGPIINHNRAPRTHKHLDEILSMAMTELGASKGNIQLLSRNGETLFIAAQRGFGHDFLDYFRAVSARDNCACGYALREQKRIIIEDVTTDDSFASMRPIARAAGFRAVQSTPLIGRDNQPIGMLSTHFHSKHRPSEHDFKRLAPYIDQAVDRAVE
ncbi:MAG: GAF domain-containing protein, partial [Hyphomicrobiales bacterium]|nr:GAF domain-containing protein [Hyphomicrobiales bacterium]